MTTGNHFGYALFPSLLETFSKKHAYGVGIDEYLIRLMDSLESCAKQTTSNPPYDILRISDEKQAIEVAVAGFKAEELSVTTQNGILLIEGKKSSPKDAEFIHRGIARRDFQKMFTLSEDTEVESSELSDGILRVYLKRLIPEAKKKRSVPIAVK